MGKVDLSGIQPPLKIFNEESGRKAVQDPKNYVFSISEYENVHFTLLFRYNCVHSITRFSFQQFTDSFYFYFFEQLGVTILTRRFDDAVVSVPIKKGEIYIVLVPFMYTCIPNTNFSIVIIFYRSCYLFSSLWRIVIYKPRTGGTSSRRYGCYKRTSPRKIEVVVQSLNENTLKFPSSVGHFPWDWLC